MPIKKYGGSLDPETLAVLQIAFDAACTEMMKLRGDPIDEDYARDLIAKRIIKAAVEHGERDPDVLCRHALEAFTR